MRQVLWTILVVLLALWLLGFVADFGGNAIHLLLVLAGVVFVLRMFSGRRTLS